MEEQLIEEPMEIAHGSGDCIFITIILRPLSRRSEREYHKGDEIAWYADDKITVRNEYNPMTAYAFGNYPSWPEWYLFLRELVILEYICTWYISKYEN
ncbi:hypothetical protein ACS0TY_026566 [Phlomoides rotata]